MPGPRTTEVYKRQVGGELVEWDESNVFRDALEDRKDNWQDRYPDADECPSDDEILRDIYRDIDLVQFEYDCALYNLTSELTARNPGGGWSASANSMGWQRRDANKEFHADDGQSFLRALLPDCDTTWRLHAYGEDGVALLVSSHDSPTGYWVYCWPTGEEDADNAAIAESLLEGA